VSRAPGDGHALNLSAESWFGFVIVAVGAQAASPGFPSANLRVRLQDIGVYER